MASLSMKILLTQIPKLVRYLLPFEIYMYQNVQFHKLGHIYGMKTAETHVVFLFCRIIN